MLQRVGEMYVDFSHYWEWCGHLPSCLTDFFLKPVMQWLIEFCVLFILCQLKIVLGNICSYFYVMFMVFRTRISVDEFLQFLINEQKVFAVCFIAKAVN